MKKNLFTLMAMMMAVLLSAGFVACGSDDDDDDGGNGGGSGSGSGVTIKESDLFGTWDIFYKHKVKEVYNTSTKKWEVTEDKTYNGEESGDRRLKFNEDMSLDRFAHKGDVVYPEGHWLWKIEGDKLFVKKTSSDGDNALWEEYKTISALKDGILEWVEYETSDEERKTTTERFKKVE